MLNLKDFLMGKKTVVEEPKKRPVGRPRKRPHIEETVKEAIPDIEEKLEKLLKKGSVIEISDSEFVGEQEVVVKKEFIEHPQAPASPNKALVQREVIEEAKASPTKVLVKTEFVDASSPEMKKQRIEEFITPLKQLLHSDPIEPKVFSPEGKLQMVKLGFSPVTDQQLKKMEFHVWGMKGAEHGVKGKEFGKLGGRPRKLEEGQEGYLVGSGNRRLHAVKPKKDMTFGVHAKFEMCQLVESLIPIFEKEGLKVCDVYTYLSDQTGRTKTQVELSHTGKEHWIEEIDRLQLGKGSHGSLRKRGSRGQVDRFVTAKGLRAQGGGAKAVFSDLYGTFKAFFKNERDNGRYIDSEDLVFEFEGLLLGLQSKLEEEKRVSGSLSLQNELRLIKVQNLTPRLSNISSTRDYWARRLKHVVGARLLKPQRLLNLSLSEEMHRIFQTWKDWDFKMHMICFGSIEWLAQHVKDPEEFRARIKTTVLSWLDQVPLWVKPRCGKQLYGEWELQKSKKDRNKVENLLGAAASWSQKTAGIRFEGDSDDEKDPVEEAEADEVEEKPDNQGMTQKRGVEGDNADRYRITIELQQDLYNWLDPSLEPVAKHGKPMLILIGTHGRLSNVDDNHNFIKDEQFEYQGVPVLRKAGTSARGLLRNWVKLRRENPVAREMLKDIEIMQQPSGFQDSIISTWRIESQSEVQRLTSRDLNSSYLSEVARQASFLAHEVNHFEGGKITAVIQPTDTDVAFPFKAGCTREGNRIKREMRDIAREANTACVLKCGPYEVLRIVHKAFMEMQEVNLREQNLLKCFRRNGFLAYRPDWEKGILSPVEGKMAEEMPQGSHRFPKVWIEQRYSWLDDKGVPLEAHWEKGCGPGVKGLEDMVDVTQHGDFNSKVKLSCCEEVISEPHIEITGDVDISEEFVDQMPPSVELKIAVVERRKRDIDKYLTSQAPRAESLVKKQNRQKIKSAYKVLLPKWREETRALKASRKELLEALVPTAGEKNKTKKLLQQVEKV